MKKTIDSNWKKTFFMIWTGQAFSLLGIRSWFLIGGLSCVMMAVSGFMIPAVVNIKGEGKERSPKKP
ncbi:MAG TPA: hypothetical protein G4N92_03145 [Anaerolineae bacterium]|nr:hypothetical protein [Anaerolineae bacterium]